MTRPPLLALIPLALTALLFAQPDQKTSSRPAIENLATSIQHELDSHGDRVLGHGLYSWSTRLNKIDDCRAELSVQVTNNNAEDTSISTETVSFSLGAIESYKVELLPNRLELPCAHEGMCISSTSTCSAKTKSGIVIDCASPAQKQTPSFTLEFDGDVDAASQLKSAFREAIDLCHAPAPVTF